MKVSALTNAGTRAAEQSFGKQVGENAGENEMENRFDFQIEEREICAAHRDDRERPEQTHRIKNRALDIGEEGMTAVEIVRPQRQATLRERARFDTFETPRTDR